MAASSTILRVISLYRTAFLYKSGSAVAEVQNTFTNNIKFDTEIDEIEFKGDGLKDVSYQLSAITGEVASAHYDLKALTTVAGITPVTTGLPANETERIYFGGVADSSGLVCGLAAWARVVNMATNTPGFAKFVFPVVNLSPFTPPELKSGEGGESTYKFSTTRTTKDIAGTALVDVPAGGAMWYVAMLNAA